MSIMDTAVALLGKLPGDVADVVVRLIQAVATSDDPLRTAQRMAEAEAAHQAAEAAVKKALG